MNFNDKCIPISVGITGHRDVENEQELINRIGEILTDISEEYKASPVVLLTPLAEGADRAAAKAVIELRKNKISQISHMVILPMNEEEYIGTFSGEDSISEYNYLKSQAVGCFEVPINQALGVEKIQDIEKRHTKLYANLGAYIALNTQILIAAWNGAEEVKNHCGLPDAKNGARNNLNLDCVSDGSRCPYLEIKQGGTYHVLRTRFFGLEDEYKGSESFLANREFGPVYWIKTKRKSSGYLAEGESITGPAYPDYPIDYSRYDFNNSSVGNGKCRKLVKDYFCSERGNIKDTGNRTYKEILIKLDQYNSDISKMYPLLKNEIKLSQEAFITYSYVENKTMMDEQFSFTDSENSIIHQYAIADTLSSYYQKKRKKDIISLIALAFAGLLSFNLYSGPLPSNWFILSYSSMYLLGSLYYIYVVKNNRHHEKYVDYRGIAEGIRVQFFWHLVGIKARATDKYLTKQKSSIDWVRIAVNNAFLISRLSAEEKMSFQRYKENVFTAYKLWLLNQYDYYSRKCPQKDKTERAQEKTERTFFTAGLTLAAILAVLDTYEFITNGTCGISKMFLPVGSDSDYEVIHKWLVFAVGFLPVIIAAFKVFTELLAYSKLARNFKWMRMVYNIALHEFNRLRNNHESDAEVFVEKSRKLFYDTGIESLLENGEWIGIFEERAPEMPK